MTIRDKGKDLIYCDFYFVLLDNQKEQVHLHYMQFQAECARNHIHT